MNKSFYFGLLLGTVLGAGAALLFAPSTGIEMRGQVANKSRMAADRIGKMAHSVVERAYEIEGTLKQAI